MEIRNHVNDFGKGAKSPNRLAPRGGWAVFGMVPLPPTPSPWERGSLDTGSPSSLGGRGRGMEEEFKTV